MYSLHGGRRWASGTEVDFLLEDRAGRCVGFEVKAGASVGEKDFRGLRGLRDGLGERFRAGVVLYGGSDTVPFGRGIYAAPVSSLWSSRTTETRVSLPSSA